MYMPNNHRGHGGLSLDILFRARSFGFLVKHTPMIDPTNLKGYVENKSWHWWVI
jgi:hypothetical protein